MAQLASANSWAAETRRAPTHAAAAKPSRWAYIVAIAFMFMLAEPFAYPILELSGQSLRDPPSWLRLTWLPFYGLFLSVVWRDLATLARTALATPIILSLLGLALLSYSWSLLPEVTFRRLIALCFTMGFAWWLAWRFDWRDLFRVAAAAWCMLILGAFAMIFLMPGSGIMAFDSPHPGAWSGLWLEKNNLGGAMCIGALVLACAAAADRQWRPVWLVFCGLAVGLVLGSTSKTALLVLMMGLGVYALGAIIRQGRIAATLAFTAAFCVALPLVVTYLVAPDVIFEAIGRDASFTGRTDIWALAIEEINKRPWTGFGYGVFWQGKEGASFWVREALQWDVPNAHQGWLDLGLDVGWIGPVLFVMSCIVTGFRAMTRLPDPVAGLWAPALVGAFLLYSFSESYILQEHNFFWVLFVATAAKLALSRSERGQVS